MCAAFRTFDSDGSGFLTSEQLQAHPRRRLDVPATNPSTTPQSVSYNNLKTIPTEAQEAVGCYRAVGCCEAVGCCRACQVVRGLFLDLGGSSWVLQKLQVPQMQKTHFYYRYQ